MSSLFKLILLVNPICFLHSAHLYCCDDSPGSGQILKLYVLTDTYQSWKDGQHQHLRPIYYHFVQVLMRNQFIIPCTEQEWPFPKVEFLDTDCFSYKLICTWFPKSQRWLPYSRAADAQFSRLMTCANSWQRIVHAVARGPGSLVGNWANNWGTRKK